MHILNTTAYKNMSVTVAYRSGLSDSFYYSQVVFKVIWKFLGDIYIFSLLFLPAATSISAVYSTLSRMTDFLLTLSKVLWTLTIATNIFLPIHSFIHCLMFLDKNSLLLVMFVFERLTHFIFYAYKFTIILVCGINAEILESL